MNRIVVWQVPALALAAAARAEVEYTVTDLGVPPGDVYTVSPGGLNNLGEVVGWASITFADPLIQAWKWTPATGMVLLPPTGIGNYAADDINDAGVRRLLNRSGGRGARRLPACRPGRGSRCRPERRWLIPGCFHRRRVNCFWRMEASEAMLRRSARQQNLNGSSCPEC